MSALSPTNKMIFLAVTALFLWAMWALSSVLFPFLLAVAIAYLLDPAVRGVMRTSRGWLPRTGASLLIVGIFFVVIFGVIGSAVPFLIREMLMIASNLPDAVDMIWGKVHDLLDQYGWRNTAIDSDTIVSVVQSTLSPGLRTGADMLSNIISNGQAAMTTILMIFLVPILSFFMMVEWPKLVATIDDLIPRHMQSTVHDLLNKIDARIAGFVRGQITVCMILVLFYTTALMIAGLPYALFMGILSGVSILIPFVGITTSLAISLTIAAFQVHDMGWGIMGAVIAIYAAGQLAEGNFITPKIVGGRVGLHPVVIILALMIGAYTKGIFGMMIAVPTAAAIAVLIEFAVDRYKSSTLYHGGHLPNPNKNCHPRAGGDPVK